jgi:3-oxoadipate enol-lactonase
LKYENQLILANGDFLMLHGRFSGLGPGVPNWIVVDVVRIENGVLAEHWDVIQDEATKEQSKSGLPMFGDKFPADLPVPDGWFTATSEQLVSTDFGQIVVRVGGNEQKPAMVFWPSLMLDGSMWSYQFEHYAPNYRIVLIDPPGIGHSAPLRRPITVDESATCLRQILDALHIETCIVVGNSWGSLTAAVFAADHPNRLLGAILTNGTAASPTPELIAQFTGMVANLEQCETAPDWLLPAAQQAFSANTPKPEFMKYLGKILREDPVSIAFAMKNIVVGRRDLHPTIRRIRNVPTLVIAGEQDHVFDVAQSQSLAASIAGSDFVLLPETGHVSPMENPKGVNAAIDAFLAEHRL